MTALAALRVELQARDVALTAHRVAIAIPEPSGWRARRRHRAEHRQHLGGLVAEMEVIAEVIGRIADAMRIEEATR